MVAAFDFCLHGKGGAAPSIDTAMHGLVEAAHVDHLHPDSGIALATAADGEKLTEECFGDRVVWVPWRRPGLPAGPGHRRGGGGEPAGHRRACWAGTASPRGARPARRRRRTRWRSSPGRRRTSTSTAWPSRSARSWRATSRCPKPNGARRRPRSSRPSAGWPPPTGPGGPLHRQRRGAGVPLPREARAAGRAGHVLPGPLPAHQGQAAGGGPARGGVRRGDRGSAAGAARRLPGGLPRLLQRHAGPDSPPMRGADPAIVLVPGVGCSPSGATSRPPGSRASSTSTRST